MELILTIILYVMGVFCVIGWGYVLFIAGVFGYAKYRGWLTETITPAEIMERIGNERK